MKRTLFTALLFSLTLTACSSNLNRPLNAAMPQLRAQANPAVRAAAAPNARSNAGFYTLEDFRNHLATKLFETLDANRDQAVTAPEFSRLLDKAVVARFAEVDANRDGRLTQPELTAGKNVVFLARYSEATLREKLTAFFQTQDLDKDRFVSYTEGKGMLNLLFDYDHDNKFSLNEFIDATAQLLQLAPAKTDEFLKAHLG